MAQVLSEYNISVVSPSNGQANNASQALNLSGFSTSSVSPFESSTYWEAVEGFPKKNVSRALTVIYRGVPITSKISFTSLLRSALISLIINDLCKKEPVNLLNKDLFMSEYR